MQDTSYIARYADNSLSSIFPIVAKLVTRRLLNPSLRPSEALRECSRH